jgi:imidazolonepropionase-like amidohydrolase
MTARKKRLHISNARLIDGTGVDRGDRPYALLIDGPMITAVAPDAELPCPADATAINAAGMTVMPGMIDCHDHIASQSGNWRQRAQVPPTLVVLNTAKTLHDTLMSGFTSIRDAGGLDLGLKMGVESGLIPGPRLKISVNLIYQTGGHHDTRELAGIDRDFSRLPGLPSGVCDGVDACRRTVREMIFWGADWVKFCTTGGISSRSGGPLICQFSAEEVRAIVETAHAAGKPAMVHAYGGAGIDIALDAGVDSIEHGAALTEPQIERMVKQGTWLVPTFAVFKKVLEIERADPSALPAYIPRKARELLELQAVSFPRAVAAGVKIAMGTDLGPFEHFRNAVEFGHMVEGGMTPMQAIVAGTSKAAECIGLGDQVGVLRAGMLADLLLVDGDPTRDIRLLEDVSRIRLVMRDGDVVRRDF